MGFFCKDKELRLFSAVPGNLQPEKQHVPYPLMVSGDGGRHQAACMVPQRK